ncbi:MAG: hypothetical protein OEV31_04495 [Gammaproteobacteria bacterium]|nr:hypothetical protein [Gammaproteobacteria bacterium]
MSPSPVLERTALNAALAESFGSREYAASLHESHPHLFSSLCVPVSGAALTSMRDTIHAVESVVATPTWQKAALHNAPDAAWHETPALGVFLGYDFHIVGDEARLIEINTNAGGALLNRVLADAWRRGHPAALLAGREARTPANDDPFVAMFRSEWQRSRGAAPLQRIAIVDSDPRSQFLYPEFLLFQSLFQRYGIAAVIADPGELELRDGRLWRAEEPVDLVYNRLTDFDLSDPRHSALRTAWLNDFVVITPHPRAHALYADKGNLIRLTDAGWLRTAGIEASTIDALQRGIPHTRNVDRAEAEALWSARKQLFFKPVRGYGSKAVYRGDKLTRRVWEEILQGGYVAQDLAPPGECISGQDEHFKYDVRNFVYAGTIQMVCARLYQGQTTNFRTPGGGFAPLCLTAEV